MRLVTYAIIVLLFGCLTHAHGQGHALTKDDDAAIRAVVANIEKGWNTHDMKFYGSQFRDDAEFINVVGMHWHGRDAVMAAHTAFHATSFKNHNIKTNAVETRSIGDGCAIAVVTTTNDAFTTPAGDVIPVAQNRQTYVLTKGQDGWKIVHGHNVRIDPDAVKHDPVNSKK
jgi:uncharacterized protein (TIGR02246 family)